MQQLDRRRGDDWIGAAAAAFTVTVKTRETTGNKCRKQRLKQDLGIYRWNAGRVLANIRDPGLRALLLFCNLHNTLHIARLGSHYSDLRTVPHNTLHSYCSMNFLTSICTLLARNTALTRLLRQLLITRTMFLTNTTNH